MNNRPDPFQSDLVTIRKLSQERMQNCLAFLIDGFFSGIFLFILDKTLVLLQIPVAIAFLTLYLKPSFSKHLLLQQYLGLASIGFCVLKSLYLMANMAVYLFDFLANDMFSRTSQTTGTNSIVQEFVDSTHLFPDMAPKSEGSTFLGAVIIVIFGLMSIFELLSLYVTIYIVRRTKRIIEKIKYLRIPERSIAELEVQDVHDNQQNREESVSLRVGFMAPARTVDHGPTEQEN